MSHPSDVALDLKRMAWTLSALRLQLAFARLRLALRNGFNPDQPRIPAGHPDGGQWTDGLGAGDGAAWPAPDLVQDRAPSRYAVVLAEEERLGGHTIERHVGKTDAELLARIESETMHGFFKDYVPKRAGTFDSLEAANDYVNRVLELNQLLVDKVAEGSLPKATLFKRFGFPTGREAFHSSGEEPPYIRRTYGVLVTILHRSNAARGYIVRTAYPRNELPEED